MAEELLRRGDFRIVAGREQGGCGRQLREHPGNRRLCDACSLFALCSGSRWRRSGLYLSAAPQLPWASSCSLAFLGFLVIIIFFQATCSLPAGISKLACPGMRAALYRSEQEMAASRCGVFLGHPEHLSSAQTPGMHIPVCLLAPAHQTLPLLVIYSRSFQ